MLFHIISYLPAQDLLRLKLVSRRFYALVTSPQAWMNAFTRFFRGSEALSSTPDAIHAPKKELLSTSQRLFTRMSLLGSWSSEYLIRTRLLRCLIRGRPSLPFAAPTPGKPGKGSATFTFSSRLTYGCSNMDADFGSPFDKRKPQFIHGIASAASVTSSDRKGKFDTWGFTNRVAFRHVSETHPGLALYGLGNSEFIGVPNMMDVSQTFGVVYGEGGPGGGLFYLATDEKHGRDLAPFLNVSQPDLGIPKLSQAKQSTCSVWLAKSPAIPHMTNSLIGILSGSSNGVVSAFSLGPQKTRSQRYARGDLTARWLLSPGVPIIALYADDNFTEERARRHRVWALALNALGEVFYLTDIPEPPHVGSAPPDDELAVDLRAWGTGNSAQWKLVYSSKRTSSHPDMRTLSNDDYLPQSIWPGSQIRDQGSAAEMRRMDLWLARRPIEFQSEFHSWDMRRRLDCDFAREHADGAGEVAIVTTCAIDDYGSPNVLRYSRSCHLQEPSEPTLNPQKSQESSVDFMRAPTANEPSWSFSGIPAKERSTVDLSASSNTFRPSDQMQEKFDVWHVSKFDFGHVRVISMNTTAIDGSNLAVATTWEDSEQRDRLRTKITHPNANILPNNKLPGFRARLFAAGTSTGDILVWNARASSASHTTIINEIQPLRVIRTDSPGISSIAMTALYLVHGGEEGLVQAWDLLASTLQPLRTLSSRHAINNRRRAVLAAQQNPRNVPLNQPRHSLAANAICLDPDSMVLRGIVAIGGYLKYWSYSSITAEDDLTRSQKRRLKRGSNKSNVGGGFMEGTSFNSTGRRANVKNFVSQELHQRVLDEREREKESKEDRRIAGRFGLDLLGEDASEEDLFAYAKLLSEEDHDRQIKREETANANANVDIDSDDATAFIEAHKWTLSEGDAEQWKFASWQERFEMFPDRTARVLRDREPAGMPSSLIAQTPANTAAVSSPPDSNYDADPDLAEAIALSLMHDDNPVSSPVPSPELPTSSRRRPSGRRSLPDSEDDDLARALKLSLQYEQSDHDHAERFVQDHKTFPPLAASSSPPSSGSGRQSVRSKGKGKAEEMGRRG